jgi:hypothetical protein
MLDISQGRLHICPDTCTTTRLHGPFSVSQAIVVKFGCTTTHWCAARQLSKESSEIVLVMPQTMLAVACFPPASIRYAHASTDRSIYKIVNAAIFATDFHSHNFPYILSLL